MSTNLSNSHAQGVIYKKTKQRYEVHNDGQIIDCQIAGRLSNRLNINNYSDPLAIGDRVTYEITPDGRGLITELLPRQNKLARRVSGQVFEQVIAANIDQVVPVFAARRRIRRGAARKSRAGQDSTHRGSCQHHAG